MLKKLFTNKKMLFIALPVLVLFVAVGGVFTAAKTGHFSSLADDLGLQGSLLTQVNLPMYGKVVSGEVILSQDQAGNSIIDRKPLGQGLSPEEAYFYNLNYGTYYLTANLTATSDDNLPHTCQTTSAQRIVIDWNYQSANIAVQCSPIDIFDGKTTFSVEEKSGIDNNGTNIPIAGVTVSVNDASNKKCETDGLGVCHIDSIANGQYDVTLAKSGYDILLQSISVDNEHRYFSYVMTRLSSPGNSIGAIYGEVKGTGQRLSGATVTVTTSPVSTATTSGSGGFNNYYISVPVGTYSVTVAHANYISETKTGIAVTADKLTTLNFDLIQKTADQGGSLSGLVYSKNQSLAWEPIANAELTLTTSPYIQTTSNSNQGKNYWFGGSSWNTTPDSIPVGTYSITATCPGYAPISQTLQIKPGDNIFNIELKKIVFVGYGSVKGNVYTMENGSKKPVANAKITLNVPNQQTASSVTDGNYIFNDVPGGYYQMVVTHTDCLGEFKTVTIKPNESVQVDVELKLRSTQTGSISGKLYWNPDGTMRDAKDFTLELRKGVNGPTIQTVKSTGDGYANDGNPNFTFKGVPAERGYVIKYSRTGYKTDYFSDVYSRYNNDTWVGSRLVNEDYSSAYVGTLDATFKQLSGSNWVNTSLPVDAWLNTANTYHLPGGNGHYQSTLPVGSYILSFAIQGEPVHYQPITITAGSTYKFEYRIGEDKVGLLSGRVTNSLGRVVKNAKVVVYTNPIRIATTNAKGIYRFENVPEGKYKVVATGAGLRAQRKTISVLNSPTVLNFKLLGL